MDRGEAYVVFTVIVLVVSFIVMFTVEPLKDMAVFVIGMIYIVMVILWVLATIGILFLR